MHAAVMRFSAHMPNAQGKDRRNRNMFFGNNVRVEIFASIVEKLHHKCTEHPEVALGSDRRTFCNGSLRSGSISTSFDSHNVRYSRKLSSSSTCDIGKEPNNI
eukprot:1194761-Prorocentrum_minimum.AAC.5